MKPPKLKRDMIGRRVRLLRTIRNGAGDDARKGSICVVSYYYRGLRINKRTRGGGSITRVQLFDVEFLRK